MKVGTKMGGYQLLGLIARGGMGAVYEALEIQLERKVALKVIAPPNPDDHDADELVKRFMQEARTLARVNHPNVITIYTIDTANSIPFITMELVEGISFKELLHVSYLSADLAVPMFIQMLEGLHCLHESGIVHRDLKPHNIMVRVDGQIKILDFGIAKPVDQGNFTSVGIVVGSLAYMAPEVKAGVTATERSDLWNIGAIFYECLTGKALPKMMADSPNSKDIPYAANSTVPMEMRSIIAKLCAYRPIERYESAMQAAEDLRRFQRSRPPLTVEASLAFSRKVEEILAKRKGDSKDVLAADITPVHANAHDSTPEAPSAPLRRERESDRGRGRGRGMATPARWMIVGAAVLIILLLIAIKKRPAVETSKIVATPPKVEEPSFKPPTAEKIKKLAPPASVTLVEPKLNATVWLEPSSIPTLSWSREVRANEFEIQIATDRSFRNSILREPVSGKSYRPARILPEDNYYWRLLPIGSDSAIVGPSSFTLTHIAPVELLAPAAQNLVEIGNKENTAQVEFSWKCKPGTEFYQIQIGAGAKFAELARESSTADCQWREVNLTPGTYRWRVRVMDGGSAARVWSEGREFTIKREVAVAKSLRPSLAKPALGESSETFVLKFKGAPRDIASVPTVTEDFPEMEWQPVKAAKKYLLQISSDKEFTRMHSEHTLSESKFEWKGVAPGTFYWRVAAISASALQGPFSDRAQLKILLPTPKLRPHYKFEVPVDGDKQILTWPSVPLAEKYLVQLGPRRQLAQADEHLVNQAKFVLPGKQGNYFMRVAAANDAGDAVSQFSPTAAIVLESVAVLDAPVLTSPVAGVTAVVRSGRLSISFQWSKIPRAESYVLELALDEDFSQTLERVTTKEPSLLLKKVELRGRIYWRVRAESTEGRSAWSDLSYFEVRK